MGALHYVKPDVVEWREVPEPAIQEAGDALVEPVAVAACDLDPPWAMSSSVASGTWVMP
jgi:alcohol dehydrogenase